jgi:type IV secretion system protein VirB5
MIWSTGRSAAYDAERPTGNPYLDAARTWDGRLGDAVLARRNWQIACLLLLLSNLALAGVVAWQAGRSHIEPVLVLLDDVREQPIIAHARQHQVKPDDRMISASLARWIEDVRARPIDKVLLRQRLERAYSYLSDEARRMLDGYFRTHDPFGLDRETAVAVEILSVTKETEQTWRVRWIERIYVRGTEQQADTYHAVLTIGRGQPADAKELLHNPLSLKLQAVGWSPELEATTGGTR